MSLTIAIPSYNKEGYIVRCIQSILAEKDHVDEIILIDNCSTDKTFEIAKSFEPAIKCVRNDSNVGMSGNFNRCIELCNTDWLMIVHADDELLPGSIEKYTDLIRKHPSLGLIHADSYSQTNSDPTTTTLSQLKQKEFWTAGLDALSCPYGVCSAVMVRKSAYDKLGGFIVSSLSSDAEMWARVAGAYDVGFVNYPTVIYHSNIASLGPQSNIFRSVKEIKADWDMLTARIADSYPTKESREAFLKERARLGPQSYWNIVTTNLRGRNYKNVFDALILIIFTYNGLIPLIKLMSVSAKNILVRKLGIRKSKPGTN
jgi:glycosyltransferase involved in cell wall biosynthesis